MTGPTSVLVDAQGRPLSRRAVETAGCPRCRGTKRIASAGFGVPHPVCAQCGHEWPDEVFVTEETR